MLKMPKSSKGAITKATSKDSMSKKSSKDSLLSKSKDNRIGYRWFCKTISNLLGIHDTKHAEDLIEEFSEQIKGFFDDEFTQNADIDKQIMFLWRTYYDKMVEETITVLEEVEPPEPVESPTAKKGKGKGKGKKAKETGSEAGSKPPTPSLSDDEADGVKDEKVGKGGKGAKKGKGKPAAKPPSPIYVEVKKIIQTYVKTPIIHCHFGPMTEDVMNPNVNYLYIIRKSRSSIESFSSYDECVSAMPQRLLFGTIKGNLIHTLKTVVQEVFPVVIDSQFREPKTSQNKTLLDRDENAEMDETTIKSIDTSRPSDFRYRAVSAKKIFQEMTAEEVVETVEVKEEPKVAIDPDSDESRPVSEEPKEARAIDDDLSEVFQPEETEEPIISQRWLCLLSEKEIKAEEGRRKKRHTVAKKEPIRETLDIYLDKFSRCVEGTMDNAEKAFNLPTGYNLPGQEYITNEEDKDKVIIDCTVANPDDYTLVQMEDVVKGWIRHINKLLKATKTTELFDDSPMVEYDTWIRQEKEYKNILDQLKISFVQAVLNRLEVAHSSIISEWEQCVTSLTKEYEVSKENSQHLSLIMEYLKKIRYQDDFVYIQLLLPKLLVRLRYIWTMSNYYCYDDRMENLLYKISYLFTEKVKEIIKLNRIFSYNATDAYNLSSGCNKLLLTWKLSYMHTRAFIENTKVGSRWEFDQKVLFSGVIQCARISEDIANISKIFVEFENIFGPYLKSLVSDPDEIDQMLKKIYKLVDYIVKIDYDIFNPGNLENWENTLELFYEQLAKIEKDSMALLDECINNLRKAEQGMSLIKDMAQMNTRSSLVAFMSLKTDEVLRKFVSEIGIIENVFMQFCKNPPIPRNRPPFIGSIEFTRYLFDELENSVISFKKFDDDPAMQSSVIKRSAFKECYDLQNVMLEFERTTYQEFMINATKAVEKILQRNILLLKIHGTKQEVKAKKIVRLQSSAGDSEIEVKSQKSKDNRKSTIAKANQNKDVLVSAKTEMEHQDLADARLFLATDDKTDIMKYKQAKC